MKVFKDLISGDEMFSDSYPHQQLHNDAIWEVKAKHTNLVDAFQLQEVQLTKKDFMSYVKGFLKSVVTKLKDGERQGRPRDRFPEGSHRGRQKYIVSNFDEFQFYAAPATTWMLVSLSPTRRSRPTRAPPSFSSQTAF